MKRKKLRSRFGQCRPIDVRQFSLRLLSPHRPGRGTVVRRLTRGLATLPQGATSSSGQRQKWKTSKRTSCQPLVINCFCVFVGGSAWGRPKHDMNFCLSRLILRFWACFLYISLLLGISYCVMYSGFVFCELVVLIWLSVLAKWLARKTPLTTHIRVEEFICTYTKLKSVFVYFLGSACYCVFVPGPTQYISHAHDIARLCGKVP